MRRIHSVGSIVFTVESGSGGIKRDIKILFLMLSQSQEYVQSKSQQRRMILWVSFGIQTLDGTLQNLIAFRTKAAETKGAYTMSYNELFIEKFINCVEHFESELFDG